MDWIGRAVSWWVDTVTGFFGWLGGSLPAMVLIVGVLLLCFVIATAGSGRRARDRMTENGEQVRYEEPHWMRPRLKWLALTMIFAPVGAVDLAVMTALLFSVPLLWRAFCVVWTARALRRASAFGRPRPPGGVWVDRASGRDFVCDPAFGTTSAVRAARLAAEEETRRTDWTLPGERRSVPVEVQLERDAEAAERKREAALDGLVMERPVSSAEFDQEMGTWREDDVASGGAVGAAALDRAEPAGGDAKPMRGGRHAAKDDEEQSGASLSVPPVSTSAVMERWQPTWSTSAVHSEAAVPVRPIDFAPVAAQLGITAAAAPGPASGAPAQVQEPKDLNAGRRLTARRWEYLNGVLAGWSSESALSWLTRPAPGVSSRAQVVLVSAAVVISSLTVWVASLFGAFWMVLGFFEVGWLAFFAVSMLWPRLAKQEFVGPEFEQSHQAAVSLAEFALQLRRDGEAVAAFEAARSLDAHLAAHPELDGGCWAPEFARLRAGRVAIGGAPMAVGRPLSARWYEWPGKLHPPFAEAQSRSVPIAR